MLVHDSRVQPPQLEGFSDSPLFNTKAVVRQTGVPAPTLRAWERRYGVLTPHRGENDYRLYSERDMATIAWLRERVANGLTISQAIALLRSLEPRRSPHRTRPSEPPSASAPAAATPADAGRLSLGDIGADLLRNIIALDESAAANAIAQAFAIYSVEEVCVALLQPTLVRLGDLWREGGVTVVTEHFATTLIRGRLESLFHSVPAPDDAPLTLVGCAPGELHELGALMLALFLRRCGVRVAYLGQSVESTSLLTTIEATRPACLLLSATMRSSAESLVEVGQRLAALGRRRPIFYVGGLAFQLDPDLTRRVQGAYLEMEAPSAAHEIKRRLSA
jgi:DNA-binding transcriptional MerR regulator/methylmalonyl-CoA mutase cobalamin-binding subunit